MAFQYQQINSIYGFNDMAVNGVTVAPDREIFLRRPGGGYLSLGTFAQAAARAPIGVLPSYVYGVNGVPLGAFGTPQINNNLFVRVQAPGVTGIATPAAGGRSRRFKRSRRSKKYRARRSRRSRKR